MCVVVMAFLYFSLSYTNKYNSHTYDTHYTYRDRRGRLWLALLRGVKALPLSFFQTPTPPSSSPPSTNDKENAPSQQLLQGEEEEEEGLCLMLKERRRKLERALCWEAASDPWVPGGTHVERY